MIQKNNHSLAVYILQYGIFLQLEYHTSNCLQSINQHLGQYQMESYGPMKKYIIIIDTIYIIKQNSRIYVTDSRPNGWTEWAKKICWKSWLAVRCFRQQQKIVFFNLFALFFFYHGKRRALQLIKYIYAWIQIAIKSSISFQDWIDFEVSQRLGI